MPETETFITQILAVVAMTKVSIATPNIRLDRLQHQRTFRIGEQNAVGQTASRRMP